MKEAENHWVGLDQGFADPAGGLGRAVKPHTPCTRRNRGLRKGLATVLSFEWAHGQCQESWLHSRLSSAFPTVVVFVVFCRENGRDPQFWSGFVACDRVFRAGDC